MEYSDTINARSPTGRALKLGLNFMNVSKNQKIAQIILYPFLHFIIRVRSSGCENIPDGPYIIASNHISIIDPFLLTALHNKDLKKVLGVHFIVASVFYDKWPIRLLIKPLGSIRAKPIIWSFEDFFKDSLEVLNTGKPLLIYVEGGRNKDNSRSIKPGVGYLANETGYPVLPLKINRKNVFSYTMSFGRPVTISDNDYQVTANKVYKLITGL